MFTQTKTKVVVRQDPEKPVERNILAQAIVDISRAAKRLADGGLNRDAVIVLLHDRSGIGKRDIGLVLAHLTQLEKEFCR